MMILLEALTTVQPTKFIYTTLLKTLLHLTNVIIILSYSYYG